MLINIIRNYYVSTDSGWEDHWDRSIYKTVDVPNITIADQVISDLNRYSNENINFTYEEVKVSSIEDVAKEVYDREVCATVLISTDKSNPGVEVFYNIYEHKPKFKNYGPNIIKVHKSSKEMYYEIRFNYHMSLEQYLSMDKEKLTDLIIKEINKS